MSGAPAIHESRRATDVVLIGDNEVVEETDTSGTSTSTLRTVDTYITDKDPDASFVTDYSLRVGSNNGTDRYRSYLNFNVNPHAGNSVTNAQLRLYQYGAGVCGSRSMNQLMATTGWSGKRRTWTYQPATADAGGRFSSSKSFNHSSATGCSGVLI